MTIKNDKDWENYIKTVKPIKKTGILMPTSLKEKNRFQIEKDEDNDMSLLDILSENKVNNSEIDKNLLKNIKKGRMKIHAVLDLHGKKVKESKSKVFYFIKNNFEYVGNNFAYEARSIHYDNKKKQKGIYGTASKQELKELKEEGIDAQMIPWVEDKSN